MKLINYLLLTFGLLLTINCAAGTHTTTTENVNTNVPNASGSATPEAASAVENKAQTTAPEALLQDLYKTHDKDNGAIVQGKNRAILDKYFDKNLSDLIWKDMTTNNDEVGVIDFDIFYNAQDTDIKNLVVGTPKIDGEKATVAVTFENFKKKNTLTYSLVKEKTVWKIADINYGDGQTLLKYFKDDKGSVTNDSSPKGEFEGTYQIGETTCTVKPIKMAFEVKWSKGTGTEIFFSQDRTNDKYIFASDPPNGKANTFSFDDENYNSGTFYRADGKEFPIKRIK